MVTEVGPQACPLGWCRQGKRLKFCSIDRSQTGIQPYPISPVIWVNMLAVS